MPPTKKRWVIADKLPDEQLNRFLPDVPRHLVQVLHNRGMTDDRDLLSFLACETPDSCDPFLLHGMQTAVERLEAAIAAHEQIVVYGDYDADGVTATAVMTETLAALGANVQPYIPDRFEEGYGLNVDALTSLWNQGVSLILTVDCGVRSVEEVIHANQLGMELIITDHHSLGPELPPATAVINPKQPDCPYPFKQLAGVGLAFKLAQALLSRASHQVPLSEDDLLDLVAIGTVADVTPVLGENRMLVARGLVQLAKTQRPGLQALMDLAHMTPERLGGRAIGFTIGPRLNAIGRLESAEPALELLLTRDEDRGRELAQQLEDCNQERRAMTESMTERIRRYILADQVSSLLYIVRAPDFNTGIVGLVAGRLAEEFYRPVLVAQLQDTTSKGSARSIPEFHVTDALDRCSELLIRHGGHSAAAGFTIDNDNWLALKTRLLEIAAEQLAGKELVPVLHVDAELNLTGVSRALLDDLDRLRPFGPDNSEPVFVSRGLNVWSKRLLGREQQHLKLVLDDGKNNWEAIGFDWGRWHNDIPDIVDVAYTLIINRWNGQETIQLRIEDIKPAGSPD